MYVQYLDYADGSTTVPLLLCPIWARRGIWTSRYVLHPSSGVADDQITVGTAGGVSHER